MFDTVRLDRLGENSTHDKRTESTTEARFFGREHHTEAQTEGKDDERLVIQIGFDLAQQRRDNQYTAHEPHNERNGQNEHFIEQLFAVELVLDSDTGEQHHKYDRYHIFDNQDTRGPFDEARLAQSGFIDGFHDDGGRGHTEHTSQEKRVHAIQLSPLADAEAQQHHTADDGQCAYRRHFAGSDEVLDTELQTDTEEHEKHADIAPRLDIMSIHPRVAERIRPHQHTGYDIPENNRLLEQFENQADDAGRNH